MQNDDEKEKREMQKKECKQKKKIQPTNLEKCKEIKKTFQLSFHSSPRRHDANNKKHPHLSGSVLPPYVDMTKASRAMRQYRP